MNDITIEPSPAGKGRKRLINKQEWKREKAKVKRYVHFRTFCLVHCQAIMSFYGSRYSRQGLPKFPTCGHKTKKHQCSSLTMTEIRKFNERFYREASKSYQDIFVLKHCVTNKPKRPGTKIKENVQNKPKTVSVKYNINTLRGTIPVCKKTFVAILGVGKNRIERILKQYHETGVFPSERRGGDRVSQKSAHKKQAIKNFIESITCCETHYARNKTVIRRYLPCELNIVKLWKMYNSEVGEHLIVKQCFFRNIFVRKYNIGFGSPKVDVCSKCLQFSEKIKKITDPQEKKKALTEQRIHKLRSKAFYDLLRDANPRIAILSFDCQKNLPLPKIPDQACYFSMQINLYNFTVVTGHSKSSLNPETVKSFIWTESDRQRSSNEIVSAVFYSLKHFNFNQEVEQVRLVADGCGGQNKNTTMVGMIQYWLQCCSPPHIKCVELVFPIVGHSFLPPDRVFAQIERKVKKCSTIIDPETYINIIKDYSTVLKMGEDYSVFDWKDEVQKVLKAPASWHFRFQPSKRLKFVKNANGFVVVKGEPFYKSDISEAKSICKKGKKISQINFLEPVKVGRSLKPDKIKSISSLLAKHYEIDWAADQSLHFFKNAFELEDPHKVEDHHEDSEEELILTFSENEDDNLII